MSVIALSYNTWHEDDGTVLWWHFPIVEPPYVGTPLDFEWPFDQIAHHELFWTRLDVPVQP